MRPGRAATAARPFRRGRYKKIYVCIYLRFRRVGGHGSGQSWAGGLFWVWYFTPVPVLACFMIYTGRFLKKRQARKDALGKLYVPLPHDLYPADRVSTATICYSRWFLKGG